VIPELGGKTTEDARRARRRAGTFSIIDLKDEIDDLSIPDSPRAGDISETLPPLLRAAALPPLLPPASPTAGGEEAPRGNADHDEERRLLV
jgi:hypothetical protein